MILNHQQIADASTPHGARLNVDGVEYVVIRSAVFDLVKGLVDADHEELRMLLARSSADNGWDEPGMEAYDSYPVN